MAPHTKEIKRLDLSEMWARHLRESTKTTAVLPCHYCRDRTTLPSEELLWTHILDSHPEEVPKDREAEEEFREKFKSHVAEPIRSRSHDGSANKPHEELAVVESESQKPSSGNLEGSRSPPSSPTLLTATGLQILATEFIEDESYDKRRSDTLASRSIKKRAIGHGRSPTSSIGTTYSNDSSKRIPAKAVSMKQVLSSQKGNPLLKTRDLDESEIVRPLVTGKRLFEPDFDSPFMAQGPTTNVASQWPRSPPQRPQHRRRQASGKLRSLWPMSSGEPGLFSASVLGNTPANKNETPPPESPKLVRQPETRPISEEQLVAEVKGIYAGLVMVEGKCIQVDAKQAAIAREAPAGTQPKLNNEQWQALIALHRTLLHEHHDFFLASQHPSVTPAIRRLAVKYAMPARLWRHGIHSFLELLRNRLPDSLDHMLAFIYLAYNMMTLLHETVPAFEETWIECLGDLGRYRMAIEDDNIRDREVWTQISRQWYLKASGRAPGVGRLYHHLAILARPNALQQLFFYSKALSVSQPFLAAKEPILTLFEPIFNSKWTHRLPPIITTYIKSHKYLFMHNELESFDRSLAEFISHLDGHITQVTHRFLEQEYYIGILNCSASKALPIPTHDYFPIDGDSLLVSDTNNFLPTPLHETVPTLEESWIQRLGRLGKYVFGSFKSFERYAKSLTRILRSHKPILFLPACMMFIKGAAAGTTGSLPGTYDDDKSDGFSLFFEIMATHFINDTAGPLLFNVCVSLILTAVHITAVLLHNGRWRGRSLLLLVTIAMSLGFFYLTMGELLSGWQMAIGWVFVASFLLTYIQEKLANLQHSGIHAITIVAPGMAEAALVATYAEIDGKWSDRWILAAVAVLPCITASTSIWVAIFHQTTIIHGIDNGTYIAQALDVLRDIWTDVRIWHGIRPPHAPRASPDLEAQAPRVTDKTIISPGNNTTGELRPIPIALDDDVKPVEPNVPKASNNSKCESRQKNHPQSSPVGTRPHGQSPAVLESAVSNKNKKKSS